MDDDSHKPFIPKNLGIVRRRILISIIPLKIDKRLDLNDSSTAVRKLVPKILIPVKRYVKL